MDFRRLFFRDDSMEPSDAVAGMVLIVFGLIGIVLYSLIIHIMRQMTRDIVGFRFLISQAFSDVFLMVQFGVWPGIVVLCQDEIIPTKWRWHVHVYLDFTWWAMVYHYTVIAWSRFAAVQFPQWFRTLKPRICTLICALPWIMGLVQSIVEHQFSWFVPLWYNPLRYGMDSDWDLYVSNGTHTYYMICNVTLMIIPFPFYAAALISLFHRQNYYKMRPEKMTQAQRQLSIETRLVVPCFINTILFVVGQIFISQCSKHGKWMNWAVMVIFCANSFVNPILYFAFSSVIRRKLVENCTATFSFAAIYDYDMRSTTHDQKALIRLTRDTTVSSTMNRMV